MNYDSLKEQAEKLDILKYIQGDEYEEEKDTKEDENIIKKKK